MSAKGSELNKIVLSNLVAIKMKTTVSCVVYCMLTTKTGFTKHIDIINFQQQIDVLIEKLRKKILFYNPTHDLVVRNVKNAIFTNCEIKNCQLTFDRKEANQSDAVIIHHRPIKKPNFLWRPPGQIWIMFQQEASNSYSARSSNIFQVLR